MPVNRHVPRSLLVAALAIQFAVAPQVTGQVRSRVEITAEPESQPLTYKFTARLLFDPTFAAKEFPIESNSFIWKVESAAVTQRGPVISYTFPRPGSYQVSVTYNLPPSQPSAVTNVTVEPASLILSPDLVHFSAIQKGMAPPPQTLNLSNNGTHDVSWTVANDAGNWLNLSVDSGTLAPGQATEIALAVASTALTPGDHQGRLVFEGRGNSSTSVVSTVTLALAAPPGLTFFPWGWIVIAAAAMAAIIYARRRVSQRNGQITATVNINLVSDPGQQEISAPAGSLIREIRPKQKKDEGE